eukprot:COSAG06_NODE_7626_length_2434_cov_207.581585_1_plen_62_part_00
MLMLINANVLMFYFVVLQLILLLHISSGSVVFPFIKQLVMLLAWTVPWPQVRARKQTHTLQ